MPVQVLARFLALLVGCVFTSAVSAAVENIAQAGGWTAFAGTSDKGTKVCGVSAKGGGRWIGMKYFEGGDSLTIHLSKDTWKMGAGRSVQVTAEFDNRGKWSATATSFHMSDGDAALEFSVPSKRMDEWISEFRDADYLYIRFPNDTGLDWQADLAGTDKITVAFVTCLATMIITK